MDVPVAEELIAVPVAGRVFELTMRPGLADCSPTGRLRLDALARCLQDVAYGDVEDAGLADAAVWVVRKTRMRIARFPRFGERLAARTFCSGLGRMWAERRTSVVRVGAGADGAAPADVEAVSLWVHLDPEQRRPTPLTDHELSIYGTTGSDRTVTARLRHPAPAAVEQRFDWTFRATECDLAHHVNNAAYWTPLEEELLAGPEPVSADVEIEFRGPSQPGQREVLASGPWRWICTPDGEPSASVVIRALGT